MKKCNNCGAVQGDDRTTCIDCDSMLGRPISKAEEKRIDDSIDLKLNDMAERAQDFYVPIHEKIMGILSIIGGIAAIVLLILCGFFSEHVKDSVNIPRFALYSIVFFSFAGALLLFPKLMWNLSTMRYRIFYNWDTTPSSFAITMQKVLAYISFIGGIICTIYYYTVFFNLMSA